MVILGRACFPLWTLVGMASPAHFHPPRGTCQPGGLILDRAVLAGQAWIALKDYPQHSLCSFGLRFGPIVVYGGWSLFTQTPPETSRNALAWPCGVVYAYLQTQREKNSAGPQALDLWAGPLFLWMLLFTNVFLKGTRAFQKV